MSKMKVLAVFITASMLTSITACSQTQEKPTENLSTNETLKTSSEQTETDTNNSFEEKPTSIEETNKEEQTKTNKKKNKKEKNTKSTTETSEDIRPEFKEVLDSYEAYMDEYCSFMKKYADSNNDVSMLLENSQMMIKYAEFAEKIDALKNEEMNDAEATYYMKITLRVSEKLLKATQ